MKYLFIDTETTGIDPARDGVIQISGIIETGGAPREEFDYCVRPFPGDRVNAKALEVNRRTPQEIEGFELPGQVFRNLIQRLEKHIDPFKRQDKFFFVAYNALFDWNFLRHFFQKNGSQFFSSYFFFPPLDVMCLAAEHLKEKRPFMENFKLESVAREMGILSDRESFHDALYDVRITRSIYHAILNGGNQGSQNREEEGKTGNFLPETLF